MPRPYGLPSETALELLQNFLTTRYDVLCQYLLEEEDAHAHDSRERADQIVAEVQLAARWARVPATLRPRIAETIGRARRMWEREGQALDAVRRYVGIVTPSEHREFVLQEAYRDHPDEPVLVRRTEAEPGHRIPDPPRRGAVANPPRVPGHRPVA